MTRHARAGFNRITVRAPDATREQPHHAITRARCLGLDDSGWRTASGTFVMTAHAPADDWPQLCALLADRERQVWNAIVARDFDALAALSAPDYASINEDGMLEWSAVLEHLRANPIAAYELGPMEFRRLTPEVVAISFAAQATRPPPAEACPVQAAILSIWVRRDGQWLSTLAHEVVAPGKRA